MTIGEFIRDTQIAVCAVLDVRQNCYVIHKNTEVELFSYTLLEQLIFYSAFEGLCELVQSQTLLPQIYSQGKTKCCLFPDAAGNIVCLFFESEQGAQENYRQCEKYMERFNAVCSR